MHDSTSADDPMWLVQEHPVAGGLGDSQHIDVVKMTDVAHGESLTVGSKGEPGRDVKAKYRLRIGEQQEEFTRGDGLIPLCDEDTT